MDIINNELFQFIAGTVAVMLALAYMDWSHPISRQRRFERVQKRSYDLLKQAAQGYRHAELHHNAMGQAQDWEQYKKLMAAWKAQDKANDERRQQAVGQQA